MATNTSLVGTPNPAALKTLEVIQQYVMPNRFSLSSLMFHVLRKRMGQSEIVLLELAWLVANGYPNKEVTAIYDITQKGRLYEPSEPHNPADDAPMFDFITYAIAQKPDEGEPDLRHC